MMMSDDSDDGPTEQALAVDDYFDEEMNLSIPPTSGNEYLLRVRREAKECPKVVVADMDTSAFLHQQTVKVREPSGLLPVPESYKAPMSWQRLQVAEFAALRQKLIQFKSLLKQKKVQVETPKLPLANDAESWCRLCFGRLKLKTDAAEEEKTEASTHTANATTGKSSSEEGTPPLLHIVAHMTQNHVCSVLEYHINWLEATGFKSLQGRWFFALLASLQKPLTPEVCSWIRKLARLCSNIRASLDSADDPRLNELNLIICLVSRYFDQRDLADSG